MKSPILFVAAILFCAMPALGQGYGGYSAPPSMPSAMDQARPSVSPSSFPWTKDLALLDTLKSDVHSGGMAAVAAHVDELEQALKNPQLTFTSKSGGKTTVYFLADGAGESMAAMAAVKPAEGMSIVTMDNPYPKLSLYLALYYNSTGKSDQALRMADAGMKLSPLADFHLGATVPALTVARGAALDHLGRWQDEIDNADAGLKLAGEGGAARALLYWGRGFALVNLGRLDEAEAAYQEALKLKPGDPDIQRELTHVESLRAAPSPATPPSK